MWEEFDAEIRKYLLLSCGKDITGEINWLNDLGVKEWLSVLEYFMTPKQSLEYRAYLYVRVMYFFKHCPDKPKLKSSTSDSELKKIVDILQKSGVEEPCPIRTQKPYKNKRKKTLLERIGREVYGGQELMFERY